jgi:hypothetical protein
MKKLVACLVIAVLASASSASGGQEKLTIPPTPLPSRGPEPLVENPSPPPPTNLERWGPRPGSSGCCCSLPGSKCRFWDWLTYHPLNRLGYCCCGPKCAPCCPPHLYLFFLADCQAAAPLGRCAPTIILGPDPAAPVTTLPAPTVTTAPEKNGTTSNGK